jgi:glycosyltransferase involved in cell wall biosynthesis
MVNESLKQEIFFSIVIPTLNEERYLPLLLSDLAKQTFKSFEVIIVDAKSEDKTIYSANKFKKCFRSLLIIKSPLRNVSYQRNIGAKRAVSKWLLFTDADNRFPHYFLQGIKFKLEMNDADILATWIKPDIDNNKDKAAVTLSNIFVDIQKTSKNPFLFESMICIKKNSFEKLKGFNESLAVGEGSDLLRRAYRKKMRFYFSKEPKYQTSLRRIRKIGAFKSLRNMAQIELARLRNKQLPRRKAQHLYPMEGGKYFEVDETNRSKMEKIVSIFFQTQKISRVKLRKENFITILINKIFK